MPVFPDKPSRRAVALEFRSGWRLLIGATLGAMLGIAALPFYTFGIFMSAIEADTHWLRSEISLGQTCWALALAAMSPFVGGAIDRWGIRRPIALSFAAIVVCFILLGTVVRSPISFIIVYAVMAALGAASSPLPFAKVISGGFDRSRGLALGITLAGTGLSAFLAPLFLGPVIAQFGWRGGYLGLAAIIVVLAPVALLLIGKTPLLAKAAIRSQEGKTFGAAAGSAPFWLLAGVFFLVTFAASGLVAHLVPILKAAGESPAKAASIVGVVGLSVVAGRLLIGLLIDLFQVRYVAAGAFLLTATGSFLLLQFGAPAAWVTALGVGFALGTEVDLMGYCTARYFGFRSYGAIYGTLYGLSIVGVAASPVWMAVVSQQHGYAPVLLAASAMTLVAAGLCLLLPRIVRPLRETSGAAE
jgi:hypothetical protein